VIDPYTNEVDPTTKGFIKDQYTTLFPHGGIMEDHCILRTKPDIDGGVGVTTCTGEGCLVFDYYCYGPQNNHRSNAYECFDDMCVGGVCIPYTSCTSQSSGQILVVDPDVELNQQFCGAKSGFCVNRVYDCDAGQIKGDMNKNGEIDEMDIDLLNDILTMHDKSDEVYSNTVNTYYDKTNAYFFEGCDVSCVDFDRDGNFDSEDYYKFLRSLHLNLLVHLLFFHLFQVRLNQLQKIHLQILYFCQKEIIK